ncbi:MAG: TonB-dependent receptor, partial [Bacteroidota bacterium]
MRAAKLLLAIQFIIFGTYASAQKGTIRGSVIDGTTGEPLFGVTVVIQNSTIGAATDFEGKFSISADPGTYNLQVSYISYKTTTVQEVVVKAGEVTVLDNIRLNEDVAELAEVVVTAEAIKTTEAALLTVKRKSANLIDGISAASFRKIGDSDAASAVKRVTGVSVEGGKYVYVRGLGDRYTKTILNGVDIPGLDPDRNSLQIDIFPTNLIDNMIVLKSAVAEMPADFTGGVINIETKDFPEEKILDVSFGVTFNPSMHFNNDFLTYDGSSTDWLGFDTDTRQLPSGARGDIPLPGVSSDQEVLDFSRSFDQTLGASNETSLLDYSLGVTLGDQIDLKNENKLGYIFSATYKRTNEFYDDLIFGEYQLAGDADDTDLVTATVQNGAQGVQNVLIGGLAGIAYKTDKSKFRLNALRLQNGESKAAQFSIVDDPEDRAVGKSGFTATSDNLEYSQRSLTNFLLNGEHFLGNGNWTIDWRVSPTFSSIEDPDIRKAAFSVSQGEFEIAPGQAGVPSRIWRFLDEVNLVGKVDITRNANVFGSDAKFKFGGSYVFKERDYEILQYQLAFFGRQPVWSGDPNEILQDQNLFPNDGNGYFQSGNEDPNPNEYNSTVNNLGIYASAEVNPFERLKAIVGLRAENYVQRHTGRDITSAQTGGSDGNTLDDDKVLDALDFFPSVNLIYSLNDEQNLRFSYSKTIARPSFKELSFAQILDPISNRTFNGGLFTYPGEWDGNLSETIINNLDIRWELFLSRGQLFSVSGFYKSFQDPIELVRIRQAQTTNEFQPRNVGDAEVFGVEVEFRKTLDFLSPTLSNFSFNGNVTVTESVLEISNTEFEARQEFEKTGQTIEDTREMAGQAPYVINAGISYENIKASLDAGL